MHDAGFIALEIPRWASLALIAAIFTASFIYARAQGPAAPVHDRVTEEASELLVAEDKAIDAIDGDVTKG